MNSKWFYKIFISFLLLFTSCTQYKKPTLEIRNGFLDISNYDFEKTGNLTLIGGWEFYWSRFVSYNDLKSENPPKNDGFINIPQDWNQFVINGKELGGLGYGTYILRIKDTQRKNIYIFLRSIGTAYKFYNKDRLLAEVGEISTTAEGHVPFYRYELEKLESDTDEHILILHVSNFSYYYGGIWKNLVIGTLDNINSEVLENYLADLFLMGALFVMGIYHLGIYLLRKKNDTALYFGLICFCGILRNLVLQNHLFLELFPFVGWYWMLRLEYLSLIFILFFVVLYADAFFYQLRNKLIFYSLNFVCFLLAVLILFTDVTFFPRYLGIMQTYCVLCLIYFIYIIIIGISKKIEYSKSILSVILFSFTLSILDILNSNLSWGLPYTASWGIFSFILGQAYIMSSRFSKAFDRVRELSMDLESKSKDLMEVNKNITDLNKLLNSLNENPDIEIVMQKLMEYIETKYGLKYFILGYLSEDGITGVINLVKLPDHISEDEKKFIFSQRPRIKGGRGAHARAYKTRRPLYYPRVRLESVSEVEKNLINLLKIKSFLIIPLIKNNEIVGILDLWKEGKFNMSESDILNLSILAEQLVGIIDGSLLFKKLETEKDKAQNAYLELEASQKSLVMSDKMITLGTLVAGVAHEINSPLGAIKANSENIQDGLSSLLEIIKSKSDHFNAKDWEFIFQILEKSQKTTKSYSTKEQRAMKKALIAHLEGMGVPEADLRAEELLELGLGDSLDEMQDYLKQSEFQSYLKIAGEINGIRKKASIIESSAGRVAKLVKSLKSYMHFEESEEMVPSDLSENLETVLTILHNKIKQGIEIIRNYEEIPAVYCYPDELGQIWTNLIHNSIQAMNGKGTIILDLKLEGTFVTIAVEDNGPGIPPEIQEKIFQPFFTTKPAGEGSGLGLHIIGKILKKHEGSIHLESRVGKTRFTVRIPARFA